MDELRGQASLAASRGAAGSSGPMPAPQLEFASTIQNGHTATIAHGSRRNVVITKLAGERSFGMTVDKENDASAVDYPRVAFVFPGTAASRAGMCPGWKIEFINGVTCCGRGVRDVAAIFRDLTQVTVTVDTRTTMSLAPLAGLPPLHAPMGPSVVNAFGPVSALANGAPAAPAIATSPAAAAAPRVNSVTVSQTSTETSHSTSAGVGSTTLMSNGRGTATAAAGTTTNTAVTVAVAVAAPATPSAPSVARVATPATPSTRAEAPQPSSVSPAEEQHAARISAAAAPPPPAVLVQPPVVSQQPAPVATSPATSHASTENTRIPVTLVTASATAPLGTSPPHSAAKPTPTQLVQQQQQPSSGRRRSRQQYEQGSMSTDASAPTSPAGGRRRSRQARRRASVATDVWDSDDAAFFYASDDDVEEVMPSSAGGSRRTSSRQAESGTRARRSLTVKRLIEMGFTQEDAEASVQACGQNPDKCMVWIVSHLEEKKFVDDLNAASIESENQRRIDAQQQMKEASETLRQATAFTSLFQSSYILSTHSETPLLKSMLSSTVGGIAADTLMRTLLTKLLTVESKAIRWYKEACKCYMLELAARLEVAFTSHDAVTCCSQVLATQPASSACSFVRSLHEEEQALTRALFHMPENHGGVPLAFLRADESMQFNLDDDGFEVVDQPQASQSLDHE